MSGDDDYKEWAYRKAAWALDDLEESIEKFYKNNKIIGIKGIGPKISAEIEEFLKGVQNET